MTIPRPRGVSAPRAKYRRSMSRTRTAGLVLAACALLTSVPLGAAWAEDPIPSPSSSPTIAPTGEPTPEPTPTATPTPTVGPSATPTTPPAPAGDTTIPLKVGDHGALVATAQDRLIWLGFTLSPKSLRTHTYDKVMEKVVRAFQVKYWIYPTGVIDAKTWAKLSRMSGPVGKLPQQCTDVTSICADKTSKTIRFVVNGKVALTTDARFGIQFTQTSSGLFRVLSKDWDHRSSKYGSWMPRAMFFHGGEAVHFSPYFHRYGYNGGSHGCIGIRDLSTASWLFTHTPVGTRVYVYSS